MAKQYRHREEPRPYSHHYLFSVGEGATNDRMYDLYASQAEINTERGMGAGNKAGKGTSSLFE